MRDAGGVGLVFRVFASFSAVMFRSRSSAAVSGTRSGFPGFGASRIPLPASRLLSTTSGCHPTVSNPTAARRADRLVHGVGEGAREHPHEFLGGSPNVVVGRKVCPGDRADPVRKEQDEPGAEDGRAGGGQAPEPLERCQGPTDAEHRDEHRARADHPPQLRADPVAPAPGDGEAQQGQPEEQPHDQGADPDEFLARLLLHVIWRLAYSGTTPNRSAFAANATSSPRSTSASWRAASEFSSASCHVANCLVRATAARAASFSSTLRTPFFTPFTRRPAV